MLSVDLILDACAEEIARRERELAIEQAVYGLDAMQEVELHPLLARGILAMGLGVLREQAYPAMSMPTKLPQRRDRERCDLVITEAPGRVIDDAVQSERHARAQRREIQQTLFADVLGDAPAQRPANAIDPADALWLEIKQINQYALAGGVLGPNRSYASELTRGPMDDVRKLARAGGIVHAGVLVVLFAVDASTAEHDLGVVVHRCLDKGLPVTRSAKRVVTIADRIGNSACGLQMMNVAVG